VSNLQLWDLFSWKLVDALQSGLERQALIPTDDAFNWNSAKEFKP